MVAKKSSKKIIKKGSYSSSPSKKGSRNSSKANIEPVTKLGVNVSEGSSCSTKCGCKHTGSCIYFLGFVGAAVFYLSTTSGFWNIVLAILKSLVWPAFVVFKLLAFLA